MKKPRGFGKRALGEGGEAARDAGLEGHLPLLRASGARKEPGKAARCRLRRAEESRTCCLRYGSCFPVFFPTITVIF